MQKHWLYILVAVASLLKVSSAGADMPKLWPWSKSDTPATPAASAPAWQTSATFGVQPQPSGWDKFKDTMTGKPLVDAVKKGTSSVMPEKQPEPAWKNDPLALKNKTGPPTPEIYTSLAQIAERQGKVDDARRNYQQALAIAPKDVSLMLSCAHFEDRQGNMAAAESLYQRAIAAEPTNARAHNDLGLCLARQGKLPQAVGTLQAAVQMQPGKALYRNNLATVFVEMGRRQEALAQLQAVHPPATANYNLGYLLERRGENENAITCYQTALAMDPNMTAAQTALLKLDAGSPALAEASPPVRYQPTGGYNQPSFNTAIRPSPPVARPLPPIHPY